MLLCSGNLHQTGSIALALVSTHWVIQQAQGPSVSLHFPSSTVATSQLTSRGPGGQRQHNTFLLGKLGSPAQAVGLSSTTPQPQSSYTGPPGLGGMTSLQIPWAHHSTAGQAFPRCSTEGRSPQDWLGVALMWVGSGKMLHDLPAPFPDLWCSWDLQLLGAQGRLVWECPFQTQGPGLK